MAAAPPAGGGASTSPAIDGIGAAPAVDGTAPSPAVGGIGTSPVADGISTPEERPDVAPNRITDVDALRGFALLGILVVNATYFASAFHGSGLADPAFTAPADQAVDRLVTWLFETKFYLLFSFLFGYSFTLLGGAAQRAAFLRRLAALFVIGACHAVLLFTGDILTTYAVLGLVLLAAGRLKPRTAVIAGVTLLALTAAIYAGLGWLLAWSEPAAALDAAATTARANATAGQLTGSPAEVIGARLHDLPATASLVLFFQAPAALAMFLFGLAAGTRKLLAHPMRHRAALRRAQWIGFPVGLAGGAVYADAAAHGAGTPYEAWAAAVDLVTAPLLAAAYAATALRFFHTPPGRRAAAMLAPAGRMALSNYLGQSAVLAVIFTGYGFALVGRLSPGTVLALSVTLYATQLALSAAWMRFHAYGPLEWLLRAVTRLRWPAWRNMPNPAPVTPGPRLVPPGLRPDVTGPRPDACGALHVVQDVLPVIAHHESSSPGVPAAASRIVVPSALPDGGGRSRDDDGITASCAENRSIPSSPESSR